jgi:rare lipoprotein A
MRLLKTAAVLSLLIGAAAALPAAADTGERSARRSFASHSYDGRRVEHRYRRHFAYAALRQGYNDEASWRRPRRLHGMLHPVRKARSARHSHARSAKFIGHHRHRLVAHHHARARRHAALHTSRRAAAGPSRHLGTIEPRSSGHEGVASFYAEPQRLASGGWFNPNALTAAHRSLPFGTRVRVTHKGSGRSVDVTINDRGPYIAGRIIDLSRAAAGVIGMTAQGVARVTVQVLGH